MSVSLRSFLLATAAPAGILCALAAPVPSRAADASPAQAATMEGQIRSAIGSLLGPSVRLSDRPVQVTPSGDHYDIAVPIVGVTVPGQTLQLTGSAKQDAAGIWTVDNVQLTSPVTITIDMPVPSTDGSPAKSTPVTYTLTQNGQQGRIVWDPTFATTSSWTASTTSTTLRSSGAFIHQDSTVGPTNAVTTLKPAGPGHVDVLLAGDASDYIIDGSQSATPISFAMKHLTFTSAVTGVNNASAVKLIQALATISAATLPGPARTLPDPGAKPADKIPPGLIRTMLSAMQDLATSFSLDETIDGFAINAQDVKLTLDRFRIEFDMQSEAGLLKAGLTIAMQGLGIPDIPLGQMAELIPTKVEFRPVAGGVAAADLFSLANLASENRDPSPADIDALFSHGGITTGLESMTILVGGATFTGHTMFTATAPSIGNVSGGGQIVAENFDVLMQKVGSIPPLAQQGQAALVFVKGIGKTVDNKLVWDFSYKDGRILVNNVDLSAMAGMSPPPAPRAQPQRLAPTPAPTPGPTPRAPLAPGQVPNWAR